MPSLFSRIMLGEIPCYKIAEDDKFFAFLDVFPLVKGHTLVVPRQEVDYILDMEGDDFAAFFRFSQRVAKAIDLAIPCKKVGMAVVGLEVLHAHIHLVPLQAIQDLDFTKPKLSLTPQEFEDIAASIKAKLL